MKLNKKWIAASMAALMLATSAGLAAVERRNLTATYGVSLRVNGNTFSVTDSSMRPFITQDGRTYVSIAALNQMGIATAAYDKASNTVSVTSSGAGSSTAAAQYQTQIQSQAAEIAKLQYENAQLKAEVDKLKGTSSSSSTTTGTKELSALSSSEKRTIARDIATEIKYLRANTRFDRNQRFEGDASIDSKSVSLSLYPYSGTFTKAGTEGIAWNELYANTRNRDQLEDDFASFVEVEVKDMLKGILKDYSGYNIRVTIYADSSMKTTLVEADYNYSKNRASAYVYEIK